MNPGGDVALVNQDIELPVLEDTEVLPDLPKLSIEEFNSRLTHNIETLKQQLAENAFCANKYHFYDHTADKNSFFVSRRFFDIVAATICGGLPIDQINGDDCYVVNDSGEMEPLELKFVELHTRKIFKTAKGALYYGRYPTKLSNKRKSLRSNFSASYDIVNNLHKKNCRTVLVLFDSENHCFVDALELKGTDVLFFLEYARSGTGEVTGKRKGIKRTIRLSTFLKYGIKATTTLPMLGFETWEERLKARTDVPVI